MKDGWRCRTPGRGLYLPCRRCECSQAVRHIYVNISFVAASQGGIDVSKREMQGRERELCFDRYSIHENRNGEYDADCERATRLVCPGSCCGDGTNS